MSYRSKTDRVSFEALDERLRAPIRELAIQRGLGEPSATFCAHTHSERAEKPGLLARITGLGGPEQQDMAIVLTAKHVFVARAAAGEQTFAMCAPLATLMLDVLPAELADEGIGITADWTRGGGRGSYLVKLGAPDRDAVIEAVRRAISA